MREAPALEVITELTRRGAHVCTYDPVAMDEAKHVLGGNANVSYADSPMQALDGADALVIVTEWKEFRSPDFGAIKAKLKTPAIFDGRNLYDPALVRAAGFEYSPIGRPDLSGGGSNDGRPDLSGGGLNGSRPDLSDGSPTGGRSELSSKRVA